MNPDTPPPVPSVVFTDALTKLEERKKELTGAYNLLILLFAVIFIGALLDYAQGMFAGIAALVAVAALGGLGITLYKLITINKEN